MNRGKLLVSLALNKQQQQKIENFKKTRRVPVKRRESDSDYEPTISETDESDNSVQKCEVNSESVSPTIINKINAINNIPVSPGAYASYVDTTNDGNNSEALNLVTEIIENILMNVDESVLLHTLTKDGKPRKRKKYLQSVEERKNIKKKRLQQQQKLENFKKTPQVPVKRRQSDSDYEPTISESEESNDSVQKCEVNSESVSSPTIINKINIISNILVIPGASASYVDTTNDGNNSEVLNLATEIIENILIKVEESVLLHTLTKNGKPRKRKKYLQSVEERKNIKKKRLQERHSLIRKACSSDVCLKKCQDRVSEKQRVLINEGFWTMTNKDQRIFIFNSVCKTLKKRKTTAAPSRRSNTITYAFKDENGFRIEVCKTFFLTTLGFKKTNDKLIRSVLKQTEKNAIIPKPDGRGKPNNKKFDREIIVKHIESFNPCIPHYRREHAPLRRYLPSDITITLMYKHFKEKYPNVHFSYYLYREVVSSLNISFSKLGHEECFTCEVFLQHSKNSGHKKDNLNLECDACKAWNEHHESYKSARAQYKKDCSDSKVVITTDLQKVIMLPRCDTFKEVIFVPRLVAYNESFIPGGKKSTVPPIATVWHEATAGRSKRDIISAFYNYFLQIRDIEHVILWADNCAAQNKNWCLYGFFVYLVNCDEVALNHLELKYFESGHTFMAADSFHHAVENSLKRKGKVYDFNDYVETVSNSYKGVTVVQLSENSFYDWQDHTSQYKLNKITPRPYLNSMVEVHFKRGERIISYSQSYGGPLISLNFLNHKSFKTGIAMPKCKGIPRGICNTRKQTIVSRLGPIFPRNRLNFWENLPTIDKDVDDSD